MWVACVLFFILSFARASWPKEEDENLGRSFANSNIQLGDVNEATALISGNNNEGTDQDGKCNCYLWKYENGTINSRLFTRPCEIEGISYTCGIPFADCFVENGIPNIVNVSTMLVIAVLVEAALISLLCAFFYILTPK